MLAVTIAPDEFGLGQLDGLEPIIDGVSLIDILKWADGEIQHAGLTDIGTGLRGLSVAPTPVERRTAQVLGCLCGVDECSGVWVAISADDETVTWSVPRTRTAIYENVGPFVFERAQYVSAVERPLHAERPVREQADLSELAAGIPGDHAAWLRSMTMAFGRDFFTPGDPELPRQITVQALRAFASRDDPLGERAVREWAADRNFSEDAIESYVGCFGDLAVQARTPFN